MSAREISKEAKYSIINCTITYIEELTSKVYEQSRSLNNIIDDFGLTDEEIDIPLGNLLNNEGGDDLIKLFQEKLGWEE